MGEIVPVPNDIKHALWVAKSATDIPPSHADKIVDALTRMTQMDRATLDLAESHPNILRALTSAKE